MNWTTRPTTPPNPAVLNPNAVCRQVFGQQGTWWLTKQPSQWEFGDQLPQWWPLRGPPQYTLPSSPCKAGIRNSQGPQIKYQTGWSLDSAPSFTSRTNSHTTRKCRFPRQKTFSLTAEIRQAARDLVAKISVGTEKSIIDTAIRCLQRSCSPCCRSGGTGKPRGALPSIWTGALLLPELPREAQRGRGGIWQIQGSLKHVLLVQ